MKIKKQIPIIFAFVMALIFAGCDTQASRVSYNL